MNKSTALLLSMIFFLVACSRSEETPVLTDSASELEATSSTTDDPDSTSTPVQATPESEEAALSDPSSVLDLSLFDSAGLVQDPTLVDCTLTDGTETECAQLIVKYLPDNVEIGPHCPETLAEEGGIWEWDGENPGLYRLNEAFWLMVAEQGFTFFEEDGSINIEDPGPEGPNAVLEGNNCIEIALNESAELTMLIPTNPIMADSPTELSVASQVGVSLSAIPIFSDAPSVFQTNNLPALDPCGGHVDPGGWYHWHATATDMESTFEYEGVEAECYLDQSASGLFAYAFDGFPIYGSADPNGTVPTDLDECNGHFGITAEYPDGIYHYHASLEFPNLPTCLVGMRAEDRFTSNTDTAIPDGDGGGGEGPPANGQGRPPANGN